ncbi:MAG: carbohydrate ABC transporter permease [Acidimicrobiia bacterium]
MRETAAPGRPVAIFRPWERSLVRRVAVYVLLASFGVGLALPFLWMLSTGLKPDAQVFAFPPEWVPSPALWRNFGDSLTLAGHSVDRYLLNTTIISISNVVGVLLISSLTAFAFARLRFPGRDALFILVISTMMIPFIVYIVPTFILFQRLGWLDTFRPLIAPVWLGQMGGAFHIFLMRQFFLTIPMDLDEAARVDGASSLRIYWHIILPLAKPVLATSAILTFAYHWNDFLWPLIVLSSSKNWTLALYLASFQGYMIQPRWNLLMAAATILTLPSILIFFLAQRHFIRGITMTGIRG